MSSPESMKYAQKQKELIQMVRKVRRDLRYHPKASSGYAILSSVEGAKIVSIVAQVDAQR